MGALVECCIFRKGNDDIRTDAADAWRIKATDIDGKTFAKLRDLVSGKKAVLVTNIARN